MIEPSSQTWAVVGGGALGLTLARRLAEAGRAVTLIEAAPDLGGLASAWKLRDGVIWDRHYHVTLLSDTHTRGMVRDVGLGDEMDFVETRTGFFSDGRLYPMSNAVEYLKLPALSPIDKARLAATIVYGSRIRDWKKLERITVEQWLTRMSGRRTFESLWLPLLRAKLGESYRETSAAFIWATIARLYAARRTGLKKEMFGYVRGGYARVFDRYEALLRNLGVEIRTAAPVSRVARAHGGVEVRFASGDARTFDNVVVTAAAPIAAKICEGLERREHDKLAAIRYQGIVCASLLLDRPLAGYYLTYLMDDWVPFTTVIEMTAMVDPKHVGGHTLVYLPKYVSADDPFFSLPDAEVEEKFLSALERMFPGRFSRRDVRSFKLSRVKNVFPIPRLGYSQHLPPMTTSVPGLHVVSSAHIVNGTLNVNDTLQLAEKAAAQLIAQERESAGDAQERAA